MRDSNAIKGSILEKIIYIIIIKVTQQILYTTTKQNRDDEKKKENYIGHFPRCVHSAG